MTKKKPSREIPTDWQADLSTDSIPADLETGCAPSLPRHVALQPKDQDAIAVGDHVGDFTLLAKLGQGAAGTVYLARERSLDREVALKISEDRGAEARTMASLEHSNIVQVFSESVDSRLHRRLLCMQYVPGTTLQSVIGDLDTIPLIDRSGARVLQVIDNRCVVEARFNPDSLKERETLAGESSIEASCRIGARIAEALGYAHRHDVLHRDIKPSNILIDQFGRPLLADFGLSVRSSSDDQQMFGGTIPYMAPEHLDAFNPADPADESVVDERSDIFSLGVVLYQWLTGKFPFPSCNARSTNRLAECAAERRSVVEQLWPNLSAVPPMLAEIVLRCLQPDKSDRFQQAPELARALEACHRLESAKRQMPSMGPLTQFIDRHRYIAAIVLSFWPHALGVIAGVSFGLSSWHGRASTQQLQEVVIVSLVCCAVIFPLMGLLVYLIFRSAFLAGRLIDRRQQISSSLRDSARKRVLAAPWTAVGMSVFCWCGHMVVMPVALAARGHGLATRQIWEFEGVLVYGVLIASSYTFLILQYAVIRVWYPLFCNVAPESSAWEKKMLAGIVPSSRLFVCLASLVPLIAAIYLIVAGPEMTGDALFRVTSVSLIVLGGVGVLSSLRLFNLIEQTSLALTRSRS